TSGRSRPPSGRVSATTSPSPTRSACWPSGSAFSAPAARGTPPPRAPRRDRRRDEPGRDPMATYHAIAAVGQAIRRLLEAACPRGEFPAAQFLLIQTGDFQAMAIKEGVSLFLYRVAVNGTLRNRPARVAPDGRRYRPSLPLDLYYLLAPWAETAVKQQRLLGWAMRALEDTAILPAGPLNHPGPDRDTFGPPDAAEPIS